MALDSFNTEIEQRAALKGSYIAAITEYIEEKEMCEYDVVDLLHPLIIEKVKTEYKQKNYFKDERVVTLEAFFEE